MNIISKIAPVLMTLLFIGVFWEFSQFSQVPTTQAYTIHSPGLVSDIHDYLATTRKKIWFDENGFPKILLDANTLPQGLRLKSGTVDFTNNGVILGYNEAQMMIQEGLIKWVGSEIPDFFGVSKIRIVGIFEPTNTFLDDTHVMGKDTLGALKLWEDLYITQTPFGDLKIFYLYDEKNIPAKLNELINPKKKIYTIDEKEYLPVYIGYTEAQMMIEENIFSKKFDTIDNLFGNNLVVAWLPKKTYTMLDMMHFVPRTFLKK